MIEYSIMTQFSLPKDLRQLPQELDLLKKARDTLLQQREFLLDIEEGPKNFRYFVQRAWPLIVPGRQIKWNWHLEHYCVLAEALKAFEISDLGLCVPPRSSKSTIFSVLFPCWCWLDSPHLQFLCTSHKESLAVRDSVASRTLIRTKWYQERYWDKFQLVGDQDEKHKYRNDHSGQRYAQGILAGITGEGGDIQIIDDPHDAEKAQSEQERQNVIDAIDNKLATRFNDFEKRARLIVMQRLHEKDAVGHLVEKLGGDFTVVTIPMQYEGKKILLPSPYLEDPREVIGESIDPKRFPDTVIKKLERAMGEFAFQSQMQQNPTPKGGGLIKNKWWHKYSEEKLPEFEYVIMAVDGAFTEQDVGKEMSFDPRRSQSAWSVWGKFTEEGRDKILLIDSWADWVDFTDFKAEIMRAIVKYTPDSVLIENKGSGISLIQSLKRANIPVIPDNPDRSKLARVYNVQIVFEDGMVYYIDNMQNKITINQCAAFPKGTLNDLVDTVTLALIRFMRLQMAQVKADMDEDEEEEISRSSLFSLLDHKEKHTLFWN